MSEIALSMAMILFPLGLIGHLLTYASMYRNHKWPMWLMLWGIIFGVLGFVT